MLIAAAGLLPLSYNACSGQKFNTLNDIAPIPLVAKTAVVSSKRFDSDNMAYAAANGDVSSVTEQPVQTVTTPTTTVTTEIPAPAPINLEMPATPTPPALTPTTFPTKNVCSNDGTKYAGGNLTTLKAAGGNVKVLVTPQVNSKYNKDFTEKQLGYSAANKICAVESPTMIDDIINSKKIDLLLNSCNLAADSTYSFWLVNAASSDADLAAGKGVFGRWDNKGQKVESNQATAKNSSGFTSTPVVLLKNNVKGQNGPCEAAASPLAILLQDEGQSQITMSSLVKGILFDLLGEENNHEKVNISWLRQSNLYWVVKPDANGEVKGINELFGNHTKGPDGAYAANGYEALAKFDGTDASGQSRIDAADGMITAADPIFRELRLWNDSNRDGIAQKYELLSLEEKGIVAIDLKFDDSYSEVDKYGNQILMKSVVQMASGDLQPIFDIWFRYY